MWFKLLTLVHVCAGFPLKCPEPAQWTLRANGHCTDPSKYFCLQNDLINGYSENCTRSDFQQPGRKAVLRGGIDADICSQERYQPFPIKFYTNASSNCIFLKSFCNEEGQVEYDQGNRNTDSTCRCDHRKGYDFLMKPNNQCFCKPSQEDCSCYLRICPNRFDILSPDYQCINKTYITTDTRCRQKTDENDSNGSRIDVTGNIRKEDDIYGPSLHDKNVYLVPSKKPREIMIIVIIVVLSTGFIFGGVIVLDMFVLCIRRNSFKDDMHAFDNGHEAALINLANKSMVNSRYQNQLPNQGQELSETSALTKRPPPPSRPPCQQSKDKNETYAKPIVEKKRQATESRTTESSEKTALPKRPPPPSRPSCPQSEEQTRIRNDEDIQQQASLYGIREENEIRLVMVGRTGSGKSATGNTIMAKADHFESKLAGGSVTRECKRGECSKAGRKIVLVDTPGIFDTELPYEQISQEIVRCVNMSTPGPHAFLLVLQIARFTDEEIETFNRLFDLFGAEMGKFAIITFTRLDDLESEKNTIETYIQKAPKKLTEFLNRCNGRYIAIDNKASKKNKSAKVKTLIQLVDDIVKQNGGQCYTNGMYKEAEAALQRKVQKVEEEKEREKKKEIEQIELTYVHKMKSMTDENTKLEEQVRSNKELQRQVKMEKDKAQNDFQKAVDELKKVDKKHNQELYQINYKEKEDKEKQAKILEEKDRKQTRFMNSMKQQQMEMERKYQDMERQKELQLLKVTEDHNKRMAAEIQRILDGNNLKYSEMMRAMNDKNKANEKLQQKMAQQNTAMNELMHKTDKEFHKLKEEHRQQMMEGKYRANETLQRQLEEQKKFVEATTKAVLQEQIEMDKRKRNDQQEENNRAYSILQEQLAQQNATMQNMIRERDNQIHKHQEEHKNQLQEERERILFQDRERDKIKRQELQQQLENQEKAMQKLIHENVLSQQSQNMLQDQIARPNESARKQQEEHKKIMQATTVAFIREQKERDKRQRDETQRERMKLELKRQYEGMQEQMNRHDQCSLS